MSGPMRFECAPCAQLVGAAAFRVEGGRLWLSCERCGREAPLLGTGEAPGPGTEEAPAQPRPRLTVLDGGGEGGGGGRERPPPEGLEALQLPAVPEGHCPGCLEARAPAAAGCLRCGLDFLRADPTLLAPSERLVRDWAILRAAWDEPRAHQRFLERAADAGELNGAGRLYRLHLLLEPGDAAATEALEGLVQRALAVGLIASAKERDEGEARRRARLLQLLMVVLVLAALSAMVALVWSVRPGELPGGNRLP